MHCYHIEILEALSLQEFDGIFSISTSAGHKFVKSIYFLS